MRMRRRKIRRKVEWFNIYWQWRACANSWHWLLRLGELSLSEPSACNMHALFSFITQTVKAYFTHFLWWPQKRNNDLNSNPTCCLSKVSVWTNYKSQVNLYSGNHGGVFSGFASVVNKVFSAERFPAICLCWSSRMQLIDKVFCPCHQGLMSFCQLLGSPVPHSVLLLCSSLYLTDSPSPHPCMFFIPSPKALSYFVISRGALKLLSQSELFLKPRRHQIIKLSKACTRAAEGHCICLCSSNQS